MDSFPAPTVEEGCEYAFAVIEAAIQDYDEEFRQDERNDI
jgi:hypothetical protein